MWNALTESLLFHALCPVSIALVHVDSRLIIIDITCSKNGLSRTELEDILSCDDEVLGDIYEWYVITWK